MHGSKGRAPVTVLSDLEARFGKPFYALALLAVGPGHAVMLFQTKEGEPGRSSRGVLDVRGSDARAEPLAMTGDLSAGYDGRGRVWVVETAPGGGASLWQIPVDAGGVGDAVVVEALPSHASLLGAEADHLWFSGAHGLALRSDSGEWLRYPLPDGVRYARPARDGGAWVEGAVVGRVGPR